MSSNHAGHHPGVGEGEGGVYSIGWLVPIHNTVPLIPIIEDGYVYRTAKLSQICESFSAGRALTG